MPTACSCGVDDDVDEDGNAGPAACEISSGDDDEAAMDSAERAHEDDSGDVLDVDLAAGAALDLRLGTTTTCKSDHLR